MARIMALDIGLKRTGIAVSDPNRIIASGLETVASDQLINYLKAYFVRESVSEMVIGQPVDLQNRETDGSAVVRAMVEKITAAFPDLIIHLKDERFTSKMASQSLVSMGAKKKDRQTKGNIDLVAATILLQEYMANTM